MLNLLLGVLRMEPSLSLPTGRRRWWWLNIIITRSLLVVAVLDKVLLLTAHMILFFFHTGFCGCACLCVCACPGLTLICIYIYIYIYIKNLVAVGFFPQGVPSFSLNKSPHTSTYTHILREGWGCLSWAANTIFVKLA